MNKPKSDSPKGKKPSRRTVSRDLTDEMLDTLPEVTREAFLELSVQNEALRIAQEEMQTQNELLIEAALALEAERARYHDLFYTAPDPSLLTDLEGVIQEANPAAQELLGVGPRFIKGKPLTVYVAPDSRPVFLSALLSREALGTGKGGAEQSPKERMREQALYLRPRKGSQVYATLQVSPVPDAGGTPVGLRWLVRGVTADPGAELERFRRLLAEVRDFAIILMDPQGNITSWNIGAEIIFGYARAEVIGQPASILFTPEDQADGAPEQEMAQAAAMGTSEDERWHIRKDGSRLWGSGVMTALRDDIGGPPSFTKIARDLTQSHQREQRERTIAAQLQASVQPAAPATLPGLAVRSFYRAADQSLSVGGDFFDVFGLGDGRSVLAVGDVSGKGLSAAAQVAAVRNMLRYCLYDGVFHEGRAMEVAITALNRTLTEHGLLAGLATLFVSVFDPESGILAYVNCGQEAALVTSGATGTVTALSYTGPVLGLDTHSRFAEKQITLAPGDALTVFTDGLTDMGPSRRQMLMEAGVISLLEKSFAKTEGLRRKGLSAQQAADVTLSGLVEAVEAQEAECIPDDICVLVVVAG